MEEKQVFNPHQATTLRGTRDETVQDTGCDEGLETRGCCRPGAGHEGKRLEEEEDGETAPEARDGDDEESAYSQTEDVSHDGFLHVKLGRFPFAIDGT